MSAQSREITISPHLLAPPVSLWVAGLPMGISMSLWNTSLSWTLLTQLRFRSSTVTWAGLVDPCFPAGFPCSGEGRLNNSACLHLQHLPSLPSTSMSLFPSSWTLQWPSLDSALESAATLQDRSSCLLLLPFGYLNTYAPKYWHFLGTFFLMMMMQKKACLAGYWTTNIKLV